MEKVVTIAGSDATGGGGLEADLKTFQEFGTFGLAAITSIVTLNPNNGSHLVSPIDLVVLQRQLASVFAGPIAAIKTGLLLAEQMEVVTQQLKKRTEKIVVDPVIGGKKTQDFIGSQQVVAMQRKLVPQALVITPNLYEAGLLSEMGELKNQRQMEQAAKKIALLGAKHVVIKGGARLGTKETLDLHYDGTFQLYPHPVIPTVNNHGAGCTFSAAITAGLAKGKSVEQSIRLALAFVQAAILAGEKINPYTGHVWHGAYNQAEKRMENEDEKE